MIVTAAICIQMGVRFDLNVPTDSVSIVVGDGFQIGSIYPRPKTAYCFGGQPHQFDFIAMPLATAAYLVR